MCIIYVVTIVYYLSYVSIKMGKPDKLQNNLIILFDNNKI